MSQASCQCLSLCLNVKPPSRHTIVIPKMDSGFIAFRWMIQNGKQLIETWSFSLKFESTQEDLDFASKCENSRQHGSWFWRQCDAVSIQGLTTPSTDKSTAIYRIRLPRQAQMTSHSLLQISVSQLLDIQIHVQKTWCINGNAELCTSIEQAQQHTVHMLEI